MVFIPHKALKKKQVGSRQRQVAFFLFSSGWYSSGTCQLDPMQNIQASNLMRMLLFVMVVVNIYSNWPRKGKKE